MADDVVQKITITTEGADKAVADYKSVGDAADQTAGQIQKVGKDDNAASFFTKLADTSGAVVTKLNTAGEAVNAVGGKIGDLASKISGFGESWKGIGETVGTVGENVTKAGGAIETLGPAITSATGSFSSLVQGGTTVVSTLKDVVKGMDDAQAKAASLKIGEAFTAAGTGLQDLGGKITAVGQNLEQFGGIGLAAGKAIEGIGTAATTAGKFISDAAGPVSQFVQTLAAMPQAIQAATTAIGVLRTAALTLIAALGPIGIALIAIGAAVTLAITYWPEITDAVKKFATDGSGAIGDFVNKVKAGFDLIIQGATAWGEGMEAIWLKTVAVLSDAWASFLEKLTKIPIIGDMFKGAAEGARKFADDAQARFDQLQTEIQATSEKINKDWTTLFGDTTTKQNIDKTTDALKNLGDQATGSGAQALKKMWEDGAIGADAYKEKLLTLNAISPLSPDASKLRQQWIDGKIGIEEYKNRLVEINAIQIKPDLSALAKQFEDGKISADQLKQKLTEISTAPPVKMNLDQLLNQFQAGKLSADQLKQKLKDLGDTTVQPPQIAPPNTQGFLDKIKGAAEQGKLALAKTFDMSAHADEFDQSLNKMAAEAGKTGQQINDALKIKPLEDPSGAGQFSNLVQAAEKAANEIEAVFNNIKPEFSGGLDFSGVVDAARSAANDVEAVFNDIKPEFSGGLDFSGVVDAARSAANDVEAVFNDIKPEFSGGLDFTSVIDAARSAANEIEAIFGNIRPEFSGGLDFSGVVDAARSAANEIEAVFQSIKLEFSGSIDFGAIINAAQEAAQQIEQIFAGMNLSGVRPELDFSGAEQASQDAVDKIQQIFDKLNQIDFSGLINALSNAAQTAAGNVSFEMGNIDFSGLISQIDNVIQAFNDMADAAANAAAESANAQAQGAGSFALGGLFRGRPGTDSNLAWISDMEYILRPEVVAKYGVSFLDALNSLQFSFPGFRQGGLNLAGALSNLSFSPRIAIPAFAGGGLNTTSISGASQGRAVHIHIGNQSFSTTASQDVAKQLERAAIAQQASSTGTKPRWVK